jgi:hypothetical protein
VNRSLCIAAALGAVSCLGELPGQQLLANLPRVDFPWDLVPIGDLDGDGYEDILAPSIIPIPPAMWYSHTELRFYSGRDGSLIRRGPFFPWPNGNGAATFPAGDHDQDGVRDYLCRHGDQTTAIQHLTVRSGRDDSILWARQEPFNQYWAFHAIADVDINGDGHLDVVVGHPTAQVYGKLWAYDHLGNLLYTLVGVTPGPLAQHSVAQSLAGLGDVNGDGCDDYIVGLGDNFQRGSIAVVSGINGQILRIVHGLQTGDYIGTECVGTGDLDGDGLPDFAGGGGMSGSYDTVHAFSSATGNRLFAYYDGSIGNRFGTYIRVADYDQDGIDDLFCPWGGGLKVVSGRSGTPLLTWTPGQPVYNACFECVPLFTPEGFPNFLTTSFAAGALLMSAVPTTADILGHGCPIGQPTIPRIGVSSPDAQTRRLTLAGAEPNSFAMVLLGRAQPNQLPLNLAPLGLPACSLYPDLQVFGGSVTGQSGNTAGYAYHDFHIPTPAAFGLGIDAQWLTFDANLQPAGLSNGLRFAIRP